MILVDSSAWIEFDRATGSPIDDALTGLVNHGGQELGVTEPVLMEVLAGAKDGHSSRQLRRLLTSFQWLPIDPIADFEGAATIYRACRASGLTPRGLVDCMIANVALRTGSQVLTADRDFQAMAAVIPLGIREV